MSSIEHDNDQGLTGFLAGWDKRLGENVQLPVGFAVIGLTNFGERPVPSGRVAQVLSRPVSEVEALAQAPCGSNCTSPTPVEDGFVRLRTGSSPTSTRTAQNLLPGAGSRSVTAGSA